MILPLFKAFYFQHWDKHSFDKVAGWKVSETKIMVD